MTTIIFSLIGILLIAYAYFPELRFYYMRSRLAPVGLGFNAETARKLSDLSGQYLSKRDCVIMGSLFSKKTVVLALAYAVLFLTCLSLICTDSHEFLNTLSMVISGYMYAFSSCMLLRYCLRHFRVPFILSLVVALILPACVLGLLCWQFQISNINFN